MFYVRPWFVVTRLLKKSLKQGNKLVATRWQYNTRCFYMDSGGKSRRTPGTNSWRQDDVNRSNEPEVGVYFFTSVFLYFTCVLQKPDSFSVCGQTAAGLDQPWLQSVHGKQLLFFFLAETKQNKTTPLSWLQIWSLRRTCWCCEVKFLKKCYFNKKVQSKYW